MGFFQKKEKDSLKNKHEELKAPSSLPDTLIEQYGVEEVKQETKEQKTKEHPKKFPDDLLPHEEFLDKLHDDAAKIEYIKENEESHKEKKEKEEHPKKIDDVEEDHKISAPKKPISDKENSYPSFFAELEKLLKKTKTTTHEKLSENLVDMMKKFHETRSRGEHFFFHEQDLEDALYKKMLKLKEVEEEWLICAKEFNAAKELLDEKEREIEKVSTDLKSLIKKADRYKLFNKQAPHNEAFHLHNGKILASLNDLIHELEVMSEDVFHHHVTTKRNDFSAWIEHVFHEKKLSENMRGHNRREELIEILKSY